MPGQRAPETASEAGLRARTPVEDAAARPTALLPWTSLLQISIYWFTLNAIWGGFELFQQERTGELLGQEARLAVGVMDVLAAPIALLTMPVVGSISDYVGSRWGRRRPFILVGSLLAAVSLAGLALAPSFPLLLLFFLALQLTANIARGPFAGLVPDLVPEKQVGIASGLMGLMIVAGLVGGYLIIWSGYLLGPDPATPNFTPPVLLLALLVAATGIGTFLWTPQGPPPKPREGRSWPRIGFETFGRDILRERSYVWLLGSRFFMLLATGFFMNLNVFFLQDAFGMGPEDRSTWVLVGLAVTTVASGIGTLPGARLSDLVGRKPVIYGAAVLGALGMGLVALAPEPWVMVAGVAVVGVGSGAFLAVDWALMTDIIPKASAGRYMGLSNIVEATNGPVASAMGGAVMYAIGIALGAAVGARVAMLLGVLAFGLGALLLRPVREPRRSRTGEVRGEPADSPGQPPTSDNPSLTTR
jgi:MFS family permease